jgi:hypothetical protein
VSNDNVVKLIQPGAFDDQFTEILRAIRHRPTGRPLTTKHCEPR